MFLFGLKFKLDLKFCFFRMLEFGIFALKWKNKIDSHYHK